MGLVVFAFAWGSVCVSLGIFLFLPSQGPVEYWGLPAWGRGVGIHSESTCMYLL